MELQKGDIIQAFSFNLKEKKESYCIRKINKKIAICENSHRFFLEVETNVIKPSVEYIGCITKKIPNVNDKYFLKRKYE